MERPVGVRRSTTMTQPVAHSSHLDQALAVYLEPHAEGRRVLLLGEAEGVLAARLSRVAERLEIIDPEHRVASEVGVPDLPFRDAVFDLVIVADAGLLPEPRPDAVRELRRVAHEEGVLLLAMAPDEGGRRRRGAPQDALARLLSAEFRFARIIEQGPVSGYVFNALDGARNDELTIDSSLMGSSHRQPLRYLALGSDARVGLESRLWVQVPEREGAEASAGPDRALLEELQKAEETARTALQRESELLRELEAERKAHAQTERGLTRAKHLEQKLLEIEGDYDDAVGRVRFLENELSERENARDRDRGQRKELERELAQQQQALSSAEMQRKKAEQTRDNAQGELDALQDERAALEGRLKEAAGQILALGRDIKHHQTVGKDLLEELRRREEVGQVSIEHDARVAELEAERARAVERVLEAELARESATLRADELRAKLHAALESALRAESRAAEQPHVPEVPPARSAPSAGHDLAESRGEVSGLRFRVAEAERALHVQREKAQTLLQKEVESESPVVEENVRLHNLLDQAQDRIEDLEDELARVRDKSEGADRTVELEAELDRMDHRVRELTRDLEEADRLAESHAEDSERLEAMDVELEAARRRLDSLDDELRSTQDELRAARSDAEMLVAEAATRVEIAQQKAVEARSERDDARVALSEARAILAQLAGSAGEAARDVSQVPAFSEKEGAVEAHLRGELAERNARLLDVERELAERAQRILQLEENLRAQIRGSVPPPPFGSSDA